MPISLAEIPPYRSRPSTSNLDPAQCVITSAAPSSTFTQGDQLLSSASSTSQLSIPSLSIAHQNGLTSALAGRLSATLLSHLLFLKGQIPLYVHINSYPALMVLLANASIQSSRPTDQEWTKRQIQQQYQIVSQTCRADRGAGYTGVTSTFDVRCTRHRLRTTNALEI